VVGAEFAVWHAIPQDVPRGDQDGVRHGHTIAFLPPRRRATLQRWAERVGRRRGKKTALVALARKLLTIAFHLLWDGTTYDPRRLRCPAQLSEASSTG
jgi:hypothetical protein